jgi:L-fucose isomerase-like protein
MQNKSSQPLGLLIIGRKRPGFDQEWNQIMVSRARDALVAMGFACVGGDTPVVDDQTTRDAINRIRAAGAEALVVLQPSLGNGQLAVTVAQAWETPIVLWATPERLDNPKVSSCSLVAQHLWASIFRQANHPFELVYGDANDGGTRDSLRRAIALSQTTTALRRSKVGLVGSHAPGFIPMAADLFTLRRELGVQLHTLSLPQFIERVQAVPEDQVAKDVSHVREMNLPMAAGVTANDLPINSRYYLAMLDLMREEQLDALAVQCWPELPNVVGQWPYLAFARLTDEGHAIALEGDVDGALTCLIAKMLGIGVGFITDWLEHDASTITFWHPGNAPPQMCNPCGSPGAPTLNVHFNINKPLVVDALLKTDIPMTIARLWRCDAKYHLTAFEGRTIPMRRKLTGNTALVEVNGKNVYDWFDTLAHAGLPHHVVLFAGHHQETFRRLARIMRIDWVQ